MDDKLLGFKGAVWTRPGRLTWELQDPGSVVGSVSPIVSVAGVCEASAPGERLALVT